MIACAAERAASSGFPSPTLRATVAIVAMLRPSATAKMIVSIDSVKPTAASASLPSRDTQKALTMPNSDSISISSTIGTASMKMARPMLPCVKS
jgi:hypothetical protein